MERWEKTYTGIKTGAKVGLYVCATIATAGGTAAISAGTATVTAGQAAGILVGGADCALEVTSSAGKIFLGPDHKVVQRFDERTKPISEACFLYSVCTGGGDTLGEKLACLGDISLHDPDYVKMAYTYVYDTATRSFRLVAASCSGPDALNAVKKAALGEDKLTEQVPPLNDVVNQFLQGGDYTTEKLDAILKRAKEEGIIGTDATTDKVAADFQDAVTRAGNGGTLEVTPGQDDKGNDVTIITPRNDEGNIHGEQLTIDADGYIVGTASYDNGVLLFSTRSRYLKDPSSSYIFDRDGVHYDPTGKISMRTTTYPDGSSINETYGYSQNFHVNLCRYYS